jgi:periplasmic divalent cation tolerance protein
VSSEETSRIRRGTNKRSIQAMTGGKSMTDFIEVHTTIDSKEAAQKIAEAVVAKRVAACAQVSGPITSTYWWQGKIDQTEEWRCISKTTRERYDDLEQAIRGIHPYETPEITAIPIIAGNKNYLDWIEAETGTGNPH